MCNCHSRNCQRVTVHPSEPGSVQSTAETLATPEEEQAGCGDATAVEVAGTGRWDGVYTQGMDGVSGTVNPVFSVYHFAASCCSN
jgi:hypothetical protein